MIEENTPPLPDQLHGGVFAAYERPCDVDRKHMFQYNRKPRAKGPLYLCILMEETEESLDER